MSLDPLRMSVPTFVKWAGGKAQLLAQYKRFIPKTFRRYFEPFLGSGAVFFYLKSLLKGEGASRQEFILSDLNAVLINAFVTVRDDVDKLITKLKKHVREHSRNPSEYYYGVRRVFKSSLNQADIPDVVNAADFIYLNKTCYNGLYRVNSSGQFNVPMGTYTKPPILQEPKLREASKLLQDAEIHVRSYESILKYAEKGDLIYFDPPYQPQSPTSSFTGYTKDSFSEEDQRVLFKTFDELATRGCSLILSNSYAPLIKELYAEYRLEKIYARRMINCRGQSRGAIKEVLVLQQLAR